MKYLGLSSVIALVLVASTAFAQKAEVYGDYTYMQYNPTVTGLQSRALNGAGGGIQYNLTNYFGIKGDFQGYMSTQWTLNVTSPLTTPNGTIIPVGTYKSNATMFTYLFGPVIRVPMKHVHPFAELLFGGTNTNLYAQLNSSLIANGGQTNASGSSQHPFAMAFGGGLDVVVNNHFSLRLGEVDWLVTRFTNIWTNTNNQNNFRYVGGAVF